METDLRFRVDELDAPIRRCSMSDARRSCKSGGVTAAREQSAGSRAVLRRKVESPFQACLTRDGQFLLRGQTFSARANLRGSRISRDYSFRPPVIRQFKVPRACRGEKKKLDARSAVSLTSRVSGRDTIGTRPRRRRFSVSLSAKTRPAQSCPQGWRVG